ncbi:MAG: DUF438 domain-containing protein [Thermoplasmata archaeon]|nr:DUF438 domain-containing protein [Thermoplasmata archaeon]
MSEVLNNREYKKEKLKEILERIGKGEDVSELKKQFKDLLRSISPTEIPVIEQELMKEGVTAEEIASMCDIHVELFREAVASKFDIDVPPGHPLHTLYAENKQITKDAEMLNIYAKAVGNTDGDERIKNLESLRRLVKELMSVGATHYNREEMVHFPYLERRGLTAVPSTLWRKHDEVRARIKLLSKLINQDVPDWDEFVKKMEDRVQELSTVLVDMVFRENNILYPTMNALLSEGEWAAIRGQDDEVGYYKVSPSGEWKPEAEAVQPYQIEGHLTDEQISGLPAEVRKIMENKSMEADEKKVEGEGDIRLDTGYLLPEEINEIFKTLPLGISFIDKDDRVRFFSGGKRTFGRTESVIGRPVQLCHPPKSVHVVNKILQAFREGKKDSADFWINMGKLFVYIRYIPMRNKEGEYMGTLEIEQEVSGIRELVGEKRLLDW